MCWLGCHIRFHNFGVDYISCVCYFCIDASPKSSVKLHKFVDAFAQQVYCFGDGFESPAHTSMELVKTPTQNTLRNY